MNINPPLLFQDPNPLTSTEAGIIYVDPRPSIPKYLTPPCSDASMLYRPCLVSRFSVTRDVGDSATVFESTVGPNENCTPFSVTPGLLSWKDIPLTFFRNINFEEEVMMEAVCSDEVKGRFAIHIQDYPTNRSFDTDRLRNRVEYWDLSETKRFTFTVNPTANFYWKARFSDTTQTDDRPGLIYWDETSVQKNATINSIYVANNDPELNEFGRWMVLMDHNLQIPVMYPDTVDFLVWKQFKKVELFNAKSVVEGRRVYTASYE